MKHEKRNKIIAYIVLTLFSVIMALPLFVIIFTSLKGDAEFVTRSASFFPKEWKFENYILAMQATHWGTYFKNSIIITLFAVGGSILVSLLAGYTFARLQFKGRDIIFILLLLGLMVPPQVTIIPQFIIMKSIPFFGGNNILGSGGTGWLDTYYALIIPQLAAPVGVFLARQFFQSFPKELDEAAYIDGTGYFGTFIRIYLPLSGPLIAAFGILKTVHVWNDFFNPLIYTNSPAMRTVQLGLKVFQGEFNIQYNLLMGSTLIISIPLIIMFFVFQKHFVQSLLSSAVKG
ncbi:carbohydrate ABC transporter permease [Lederbergia panacisoli]|uniref:carbohydrate ABC transporter permease n=1 Tax=Lederbergia panacisoli TaxID=1255251 RepID=UPI00214CCDEB|nr:carbohydrate ABC transporter permease [Lederbergia panacisoli]MCR2822985.1 carbohydrate ABC transporter permease [Lederbergia panacisoli]